MKITDIKPFVPSKDHALCKKFYQDLGFKMTWEGDMLAAFERDGTVFLLQDFYVKELAENYMLAMAVDNVDEWWQFIQDAKLAEKYPGIRLKAPEMKPWGLYTLQLIDPTGVLWHINDEQKK